MGFINVRGQHDILRNTGNENFTPAVFPEFQKFVNIIGHFFEQEELDTYVDLLRQPLQNVWLRRDNELQIPNPGPADAPVDCPSVRTSSGLKTDHRPAVRRVNEPEDTTPKPPLVFILVIRGKSAALFGKVRILYTVKAAAGAMFEEAVNGYSTDFSAAILKADMDKLRNRGMEFRKVDTITQLYGSAEDENVMAFLCGGERYKSGGF